MKKIISLTCLFSIMSCSAIVENAFKDAVVGSWNLTSIKDVTTGTVTDISEFSTLTKIFDNRIGNAIKFEEPYFNIYNQIDGDNGDVDGKYTVDFSEVTLEFNDNKKLIRKINTSNATTLVLHDTINGKAKLLTFIK